MGIYSRGYIAQEVLSPSEHIPYDNIILTDKFMIIYGIYRISQFTNTNSMDPVLDKGMKGIEITPTEDMIKVGDIISYKLGKNIIIHRIMKIGYDKLGWYAITKGDNLEEADYPVRFSQITGLLVGVLY